MGKGASLYNVTSAINSQSPYTVPLLVSNLLKGLFGISPSDEREIHVQV